MHASEQRRRCIARTDLDQSQGLRVPFTIDAEPSVVNVIVVLCARFCFVRLFLLHTAATEARTSGMQSVLEIAVVAFAMHSNGNIRH